MARILLGVSGGIAAYKALEFLRLASCAGHSVRVVQTEASQRFVGAASFEALTGAPVLTTEWERDPARGAFPGEPAPDHEPLNHLELVANADVFVIAPATANTVARLATGLADNLLTSCALAATCPLVIAPAMNHHMWRHPATRENMRVLRERGAVVVGPGEGALASRGEWGEGRLSEPLEILDAVQSVVPAGPRPWDGLRVLVTAGGTREPLDDVRFLGNRSSGRMGLALAEAALARGASVTLIAANVAGEAPAGAQLVEVKTATELDEACREALYRCDLLLMAAAVADFRPSSAAQGKLDRAVGTMSIELEPTDDILQALCRRRKPGQAIVAFAAEHGGDFEERAREKLARKGADAIVVNDVSREGIGFDSPDNAVTLIDQDRTEWVARAPKREVAEAILDFCEPLSRVTRRAPA